MKYYLVSAENPKIRKTIQVPDEIVPTKTPVRLRAKPRVNTPVKVKIPTKIPTKSRVKSAKSIKAVQNTKSVIDGSLSDYYKQARKSRRVSF